jgi:hypothetical protein
LAVAAAPQAGRAATVLKVNKQKSYAVVQLSKDELQRLSAGEQLAIQNGGETVDAEVEGISAGRAKLRILYGIDSLKNGQTLDLGGKGGGRETAQRDEDARANSARAAEAPEPAAPPGRQRGPVSAFAGDLRAPWALNAPTPIGILSPYRSYMFMNPAQLRRVKSYVVVAGDEWANDHLVENGPSGSVTSKFGTELYGATAAANVFNVVSLGLSYGEADLGATNKVQLPAGATTFTGSFGITEHQVVAAIAGQVGEHVAAGGEYAQVDHREAPGGGTSGSLTYQVFRPGVTYTTKDLEVGLKYSPPLHVKERGATYSDPRRILVHGQLRTGGGGDFGGAIEQVHAYGTIDDTIDYANVRVGGDLPVGQGATAGAFLLYQSRYFEDKNSASPLDIPVYGLDLTADVALLRSLNVGAGLAYTASHDTAGGVLGGNASLNGENLHGRLTVRYAL